MFKKIILGLLVLGFTSLVLEASEKDVYQKGCEDLIANDMTLYAGAVIGYVAGTKDMKLDRLDQLGYDAVVRDFDSDDFVPICRQTLKLRRESEFKSSSTQTILHYVIRGYVVRKNGYTWDEVQEKIKEAKKKMGLVKSSKKY